MLSSLLIETFFSSALLVQGKILPTKWTAKQTQQSMHSFKCWGNCATKSVDRIKKQKQNQNQTCLACRLSVTVQAWFEPSQLLLHCSQLSWNKIWKKLTVSTFIIKLIFCLCQCLCGLIYICHKVRKTNHLQVKSLQHHGCHNLQRELFMRLQFFNHVHGDLNKSILMLNSDRLVKIWSPLMQGSE